MGRAWSVASGSLIAGAVVVLFTGCQAPQGPERDLVPLPSERDLIGSWVDKTTSKEAPSGEPPGSPLVIATFPFSYKECSGDAAADTTRLALGWPVGTAVDPPYDTVDFVREPPPGVPAPYTESKLDATLPDDAPAARFSLHGNSIHVDPMGRWVYVERVSGTVEKWGRVAGDLPGCA